MVAFSHLCLSTRRFMVRAFLNTPLFFKTSYRFDSEINDRLLYGCFLIVSFEFVFFCSRYENVNPTIPPSSMMRLSKINRKSSIGWYSIQPFEEWYYYEVVLITSKASRTIRLLLLNTNN
jgi:hypothetical protein